MANFDPVLTATDLAGKKRKQIPNGYLIQCPAHDDRTPSLAVTDGGDKVLLHCFAGCDTDTILNALNLTWADTFDQPLQPQQAGVESLKGFILDISNEPPTPATITTPKPKPELTTIAEYLYTDIDGQPIGKKIRLADPDGKKTFRQYRYDNGQWLPGLNGINLPLYNLAAIEAAKNSGDYVWIVEGEKDADTLTALHLIATTMPNGAGTWTQEHTNQLDGITGAYIIADRDNPGLTHAADLQTALEGAQIPYRLLLPADPYKDITDHINAGLDLADLIDATATIEQTKAEQRQHKIDQLTDEEILKQTARDTARKHINNLNAANRYQLPHYAPTLTAELAKPDEPIFYIIDQLWPTGANISLTATYKAGKTSTINNIVKALTDNQPLFNHFHTHHTGRIGIWNYEVSANQIRQWIREVNIRNTDNISLLNMRGHTWPLSSQYVIDNTIQWLADNNITTWIIDPLARAFVGSGDENSNQDVGTFLDTLDYIKDQAGVANLLIAAHTGRNAEQGNNRARGASRFDDWVDARWMLTKDNDGQRWFSADGRDVTIDESRLDYDDTNRSQTIHTGIGKKETAKTNTEQRVYTIIAAAGLTGINRQNIITAYKNAYKEESLSSESADTGTLKKLQDDGLIYKEKMGNSWVFRTVNYQLPATL